MAIACFVSCTCPDSTHPSQESDILQLKEEIAQLEAKYDIHIIVDETAWDKRLPSKSDIERHIIKANAQLSAMHENVQACGKTAAIVPLRKSAAEYDPPLTGSYTDGTIFRFPDVYYYDVSLTVRWSYAGTGGINAVYYSGTVIEEDSQQYPNSVTEMINPYYAFSGRTFIGSVRMHYRHSSSVSTIHGIFVADVSYNIAYGIGTIRFTDLN